jgi:hypothetical protein
VLHYLVLGEGHHSLEEQQLVEIQSLQYALGMQSGASKTSELLLALGVQSYVMPQLLHCLITLALIARIEVLIRPIL